MAERVVLGLTEVLSIKGNNQLVKEITARIDTGATASSIDSKLADELDLGLIIRHKIVKSASGVKERPIKKAIVKIRGIEIEEEFTIADRSHMTYQLLIGQNILKRGNFLVDPNK